VLSGIGILACNGQAWSPIPLARMQLMPMAPAWIWLRASAGHLSFWVGVSISCSLMHELAAQRFHRRGERIAVNGYVITPRYGREPRGEPFLRLLLRSRIDSGHFSVRARSRDYFAD